LMELYELYGPKDLAPMIKLVIAKYQILYSI
jgi:hypothetical protein